ncbi:DUF1793-domain-containing protein [Mycena epipterygia]|nr:DUF1793-domain-containing protein [Mycena epipterygia]
MHSWAALLILFVTVVHAITWTATPFNPASIPLAVRTPYLNAWLPQGAGAALNDVWPTFWTGSTLGWAGFVRVDGKVYSFLGAPAVAGATFSKAVQKSSKFTSTQSIFVLSAGPVDITVTFLSPVEPNDLVNAEWVSGDSTLTVNWNSTTTGSVLTHQVQLSSPTVFSEVNDHTQYGSAFYSTPLTIGSTYQTGADVTVRAQFINKGVLANTLDTGFRAINNNWPVFAFAHEIGAVTTASPAVVFSIGHIRDPAIQYIVAGGATQSRSLYFLSQFSTAASVISSFLSDFSAALTRANTFDTKVQTDATKISADYASVVALSIRQAFAATELTLSKTSAGAFNTTDVILFMKGESANSSDKISSDGNVNTVDVIFPAWPIFLYTNPALGKFLLEGSSYPKALGHNDGLDEKMPVEESGNMVIMALSYAQKTGDISQLQRYAALLDQWTQFLITDSLIPANQISTDDFAGPLANQTNLAIKGIVGIGAMAKIETLLGNTAKATNYTSIATSYVTQWQKLSASTTGSHLTLSYGDSDSWGLSYNLYSDKLSKLNLFPASVYAEQTAWYQTHANAFGVPLDTRHTYTKTDWEIYTAGIATTTAVRDIFIGAVKKWVSDGQFNGPFGDLYDTVSGAWVGFSARPVVGGHLALLVL